MKKMNVAVLCAFFISLNILAAEDSDATIDDLIAHYMTRAEEDSLLHRLFNPPYNTQEPISPSDNSFVRQQNQTQTPEVVRALKKVYKKRPIITEKLFGCHLCDFAFKRGDNLKRHLATVHSTELLFQCAYCAKRFSRGDNLKVHEKIHNKEYRCDKCTKSHAKYDSLQRHMIKYHSN